MNVIVGSWLLFLAVDCGVKECFVISVAGMGSAMGEMNGGWDGSFTCEYAWSLFLTASAGWWR